MSIRGCIACGVIWASLFSATALAQHEGHGTAAKQTEPPPKPDTHSHQPHGLFGSAPVQREGSGTSWLPDASAMHAIHFTEGGWSCMLHGAATLRYTWQDAGDAGARGARSLSAPNWVMLMAHRPVSDRGSVMARLMMSADRITEGGDGYPLLLQTGETWRGVELVDRQHPHDLFSELAVAGSYMLSDQVTPFVYFGFPGEPALGPTAFMHRPSARFNPDAPLAHHWQDATHITFGVLTGGVQYRNVKCDASIFTGREPDEDRYDFDKARFDSYSGRLTVNPGPNVSAQISHAYVTSPEAVEPDVDVRRTTASVAYDRPFRNDGHWSSTVVWGLNDPIGHVDQHSLLIESAVQRGRYAVYARTEYVEKLASELDIATLGEQVEGVKAIALGATRVVRSSERAILTMGAQSTLHFLPDDLESTYGSRPLSFQVYLVLSPTSQSVRATRTTPAGHAH